MAVSNIALSTAFVLRAIFSLIGIGKYAGVAITLKSILFLCYFLNMSANLNLSCSRYFAARYPFKSYIDSANAIPKKRYCSISTVCLAVGFMFGTIAEFYGHQQIAQILISGCRILVSVAFIVIYWKIYKCVIRSRMKVHRHPEHHNKSQNEANFPEIQKRDDPEAILKEARTIANKRPINDEDETIFLQKMESADIESIVHLSEESNSNQSAKNDTSRKSVAKNTRCATAFKINDEPMKETRICAASSAVTRRSGSSFQVSASDADKNIDETSTGFPRRNLSIRESSESNHQKNGRLLRAQNWDDDSSGCIKSRCASDILGRAFVHGERHLTVIHCNDAEPNCKSVLSERGSPVSVIERVQPSQTPPSLQIKRNANERHLLKLSIGIILSFVVLNLPFSLYTLFSEVAVDCRSTNLIYFLILVCSLLNSIFDPLFYLYTEKRYARN